MIVDAFDQRCPPEGLALGEWEEGQLLIAPGFWLGGILSVAAWTALAAALCLL